MFGPERYLGELKGYVGNWSRPEASIAEGYLVEEGLIFCSRYLHDGSKKKSKNSSRSSVEATGNDISVIFPKVGRPLGRRKGGKKGAFSLDSNTQRLAHRYVIFNFQDELVEKYIKKRWRQAQQHSQELMVWFKEKVELEQVPDHIKWLALGPSHIARRYTGYFINGYRFYTQERDAKLTTQNSGVTLTALTSSFSSTKDLNPSVDGITYYGRINDIIEIDYWGSFSVVLFRCEWFQEDLDSYGLTCVNFNKLCYEDDPFVLASQVHQVFYVKDATEKGCHYVMKKLSKDFINIMDHTEDAYFAELTESVEERMVSIPNDDDENSWIREGVPPIVLDYPVENQETNSESYDTVGSDTPTTATANVSQMGRTNEWKPSFAVAEVGIPHQACACPALANDRFHGDSDVRLIVPKVPAKTDKSDQVNTQSEGDDASMMNNGNEHIYLCQQQMLAQVIAFPYMLPNMMVPCADVPNVTIPGVLVNTLQRPTLDGNHVSTCSVCLDGNESSKFLKPIGKELKKIKLAKRKHHGKGKIRKKHNI
ncbi:TATA BOX ASSOCIATED FACTOR II 59 [Striga asiatica]|uniref:TATA BOX ASSOCIATED FACTOR II 59 n=1 Tax=Striga asiatica TaxID=4170 RepID=A0A5A7PKE5_STRAF|nr:TATA BOX ASSOCIATED FACTOR II 59 [Striga asiatica]